MRTCFLTMLLVVLIVAPAVATVTATGGSDAFSITLEQGSIKEAIIGLLTAAKKDYILDSQNLGPDFPSAAGTTATMRVTNAKFDDALRILIDVGNWAADAGDDGRYMISWSGEAPPPSHVHVQRKSEGTDFVITIDTKTPQDVALREIGQKISAEVFIDPTASNLMKEKADTLATVEGTFSVSNAEQAVRYVATPTFVVRREGDTIVVSAPNLTAHCSCGQALDKGWKFCPACGKAAPTSEAAK